MTKGRRQLELLRPYLLFGTLIAAIFLWPIGQRFEGFELATEVALGLALLVLVALVGRKVFWVPLAIGLVAASIVSDFASQDGSQSLELTSAIASLFSLLILLVLAFTHLLRARDRVTQAVLLDAVSVYLLIGIVFAQVYEIIELLSPGSLGQPAFATSGFDERYASILYFSFVTMTTLGYGDMLPLTLGTATLAYMQALIGQFYLVIVVARLVSLSIGPSPSS